MCATTIRKLPAPSCAGSCGDGWSAGPPPFVAPAAAAPGILARSRADAAPPESHRPIVEPLSPERYRLQMTMDEQAHDDLRWLQDALRREIPMAMQR